MNTFQTIVFSFLTILIVFFVIIVIEDIWHKSKYKNVKNISPSINIISEKPKKKLIEISYPDKNISLYDDKTTINNKGFINELMYKPNMNLSELNFENSLIKNNISLNSNTCVQEGDLPVGNINVEYLLTKNTTLLRE